jgi:hypothetical protein
MPGFLGGSGGSGTGGEISFPKEFIDPVTKLRVSQPQTLIDTDFEYGLQPTKWETVELINNTPSFFSKSGDTTINGIIAMVTTATSREIKVTTDSNHGLAVGIPINVSGTKSITADGSYIINSIPDPKSFTYLAKQNQDTTASIFDLYTSIITGEFFQGSQIKISDSQGIVTNAASPSALTVQTDSPHGFQVGTPFYFLNLNSTVSQQFDASNTGAKTFDSSNSATAQTFDGANTLTSYIINLNNKALTTGTVSTTATFNSTNKTITVTHTSEGFTGLVVGSPLYYNVSTASGYFNTNPRGIVYVADNSFNVLGGANGTSTFSVASVPGGAVLDLPTYPNGTFQIASDAELFAGNNNNVAAQRTINVFQNTGAEFDGSNTLGSLSTVNTYSSTIIQLNNDAGTTISPGLYIGAMVFYTTDGSAATGLTNNTTYFVTFYNEPAGSSVPGFFQIKVATAPGGTDITISGGTGTQKFRKIGVSVDRDIIHSVNHGFVNGDMVRLGYPSGGKISLASFTKDYAFITRLDNNNVQLESSAGLQVTAASATLFTPTIGGEPYKVYAFLTTGSHSFTVAGTGVADYLVVGGGGGGGSDMGGGGGGGGVRAGSAQLASGTYNIVVGAGGAAAPAGDNQRRGFEGNDSSLSGPGVSVTAFRGGGGASNHNYSNNPAGGANNLGANLGGGGGCSGGAGGAQGGSGYGGSRWGDGGSQGFQGGSGAGYWYPCGGGGSGGAGSTNPAQGGVGTANAIFGTSYFWGGGGGGSGYSSTTGSGGNGGGGSGSGQCGAGSGGAGYNVGGTQGSCQGGGSCLPGAAGGTNTGGGGGGGPHHTCTTGGPGGSGIVVVRVKG